jgi:hypothetical protein
MDIHSLKSDFEVLGKTVHSLCVDLSLSKMRIYLRADERQITDAEAVSEYTDILIRDTNNLIQKLNTLKGVALLDPIAGNTRALCSLNVLRSIYTVLELMWECGLRRFVEIDLECSLPADFLPKSLLITPDALRIVSEVAATSAKNNQKLLHRALFLHAIIFDSSLAGMVIDRNFQRVFLSLLVFAQQGNEEVIPLLSTIQTLDKYKFSIFYDMKYVLPLCCKKYQDCLVFIFGSLLMSPGGLEAVVRGYLNGIDDPITLNRMQLQVARLVTSTPMEVSRRYLLHLLF